MTYEDHLNCARAELMQAQAGIREEMRSYPTPISGCDAQYNYLVGMQGSVADALAQLSGPRFVATPRTPDMAAGVESR